MSTFVTRPGPEDLKPDEANKDVGDTAASPGVIDAELEEATTGSNVSSAEAAANNDANNIASFSGKEIFFIDQNILRDITWIAAKGIANAHNRSVDAIEDHHREQLRQTVLLVVLSISMVAVTGVTGIDSQAIDRHKRLEKFFEEQTKLQVASIFFGEVPGVVREIEDRLQTSMSPDAIAEFRKLFGGIYGDYAVNATAGEKTTSDQKLETAIRAFETDVTRVFFSQLASAVGADVVLTTLPEEERARSWYSILPQPPKDSDSSESPAQEGELPHGAETWISISDVITQIETLYLRKLLQAELLNPRKFGGLAAEIGQDMKSQQITLSEASSGLLTEQSALAAERINTDRKALLGDERGGPIAHLVTKVVDDLRSGRSPEVVLGALKGVSKACKNGEIAVERAFVEYELRSSSASGEPNSSTHSAETAVGTI